MRAADEAGVAALHQRGWSGAGVRIGLLDSGVDGRHAALAQTIATHIRFGPDGEAVPEPIASDADGHGTRSAGILCGQAGLGIAPQAQLITAAVIPEGDVIARILLGLDWMLDQRLDVLCLPFGLPESSPVFETYLEVLARIGVLVVAAVGNGGAGRSRSPGDSPWVLSVGAVDDDGRVPAFSGSRNGPGLLCGKPDICAPGVQIASAKPGGGTTLHTGTSAAAAFTAGVAALMRQSKVSAAAIRGAILAAARPLDEHQIHRSAHGILDPVAALDCLSKPSAASTALVSESAPPFLQPSLQTWLEEPGDASREAVFILPDAAVFEHAHQLARNAGTRVRALARGRALLVNGSRALLHQLTRTATVATAAGADPLGAE